MFVGFLYILGFSSRMFGQRFNMGVVSTIAEYGGIFGQGFNESRKVGSTLNGCLLMAIGLTTFK